MMMVQFWSEETNLMGIESNLKKLNILLKIALSLLYVCIASYYFTSR